VNKEQPQAELLPGSRLPRPRTVVRAYPLELWQKIAGDLRPGGAMPATGPSGPQAGRQEAEGTSDE